MRKIKISFILILLIAFVPCLIESLRACFIEKIGILYFSFYPSLISSMLISPAAVIYLSLIETRINNWILRSILCLYGAYLLYIGIAALDAELMGPLLGYILLPATVIFIPVILILPSTSYYQKRASNKTLERNAEIAPLSQHPSA